MSDNRFQFESLPNEVLSEIFEYFDTKNLFRSFYNLNSRLNIVIQSVNNLYLTLTTSHCFDTSRYGDLAPYIDILTISNKAQINLNYFPRIRRLILLQSTDELLKQLEINHLLYLEHLSIRFPDHIIEEDVLYLFDKIFSNGFSNLKSCCLHRMNFIPRSLSWTQVSSLRILKIGDLNLSIYKSILSSCVHLYLLKFTRIKSDHKSIDIIRHINLKKLIIVIPWFEELSDDCAMNNYLLCVPNLEEFIVHRTSESKCLNESFLKFDWYASMISLYLPGMIRFTYYFHVLKSERRINFATENILRRIQEHFNRVHSSLYQHRFITDFIG